MNKTDRKGVIHVDSKAVPTVELDSSAHAAYVRFSNNKVARTVEITSYDCIVTVDLDSEGNTVGVELVGVTEFGIEPLLKKAGVENIPASYSQNTRYVPAALQVA